MTFHIGDQVCLKPPGTSYPLAPYHYNGKVTYVENNTQEIHILFEHYQYLGPIKYPPSAIVHRDFQYEALRHRAQIAWQRGDYNL